LGPIQKAKAIRPTGFKAGGSGLYQAMGNPALLASAALLVGATASFGAGQAWQIHRQSGAYGQETSMAAFADADSGPGRMSLYCDTRDGFRVMFFPHRVAMTQGTGKVILTIDNAAPVTLVANAFGDDAKDTDVVTVTNVGRIEDALSTATHVAVRFVGYDNSTSEAAFTFDGLAAQKATLLKVCPLSGR
jgi:hypothetical protein